MTASPHVPTRSHVAGLVERFTREHVAGWVAAKPEAPPVRVSLHVNEIEVAAMHSRDTAKRHNLGSQVRQFRFSLNEVWDYVRPGDELVVRAGETVLPINQHGMFLTPDSPGEHTAGALADLLREGYVFGQTGRLQLSKKLDTVWQSQVLGLYDEVRRIVKAEHGHDAFLIYGSLLGAVREYGFIGHD